MRLNRNSKNIQSILDKISTYIKKYAKKNKIDRYLKITTFHDNNGLSFQVLTIDKDKLFDHTEYFKHNKKIKNMITRRGEKTIDYDKNKNLFFIREYNDYIVAENIINLLFAKSQSNVSFQIKHLQIFNKLHKKLNEGNYIT